MIGQTSCRHCNRGTLSDDLAMAIQVVEDQLACQLRCNSGCRCKEHNDDTPGSSSTSQHITRKAGKFDADGFGNAADVWSEQVSMSDLYWTVIEMPTFYNGGIGLYWTAVGWFMHLDARGYRARWAYRNGNRISFDVALKLLESED